MEKFLPNKRKYLRHFRLIESPPKNPADFCLTRKSLFKFSTSMIVLFIFQDSLDFAFANLDKLYHSGGLL